MGFYLLNVSDESKKYIGNLFKCRCTLTAFCHIDLQHLMAVTALRVGSNLRIINSFIHINLCKIIGFPARQKRDVYLYNVFMGK